MSSNMMSSVASISTNTRSFLTKSKAPQPPPNTPLTPNFPTLLNPFTSVLPTYPEHGSNADAEDEGEPDTLISYGEVTPTESYHSPTPPSGSDTSPLGSPKRHVHGCLLLRSPVRKPPMQKRNTFSGYGGYGGWSNRVIIGADASPKSPWAPTIRLPSSPSSPTTPSINTNVNRPPPTPSPLSPAPLPIRPRSSTYSGSNSLPNSFGIHLRPHFDATSDSETEVELDGDASSSDTCASDSDGDTDADASFGKSWLKSNLTKSKSPIKADAKQRSVLRLPIPQRNSSPDDGKLKVPT